MLFFALGIDPIFRVFLRQEPADKSRRVGIGQMGFRGEDFKLRFVEPTGLNPILGFHSRFRWCFLRRPCGAFIVPTEEVKSRFIFVYF